MLSYVIVSGDSIRHHHSIVGTHSKVISVICFKIKYLFQFVEMSLFYRQFIAFLHFAVTVEYACHYVQSNKIIVHYITFKVQFR